MKTRQKPSAFAGFSKKGRISFTYLWSYPSRSKGGKNEEEYSDSITGLGETIHIISNL